MLNTKRHCLEQGFIGYHSLSVKLFLRSSRETPWCEPRVETSTRLCRLRLCASSEAERIRVDYMLKQVVGETPRT
jgi:hypothetical protein